MKAFLLKKVKQPLELSEVEKPSPKSDQVLVHVQACGVCHTDLHIIDGELTPPQLPLILGHQIVGAIVALGDKVQHLNIGDRVGIPWLGATCSSCEYCVSGRENLCDSPCFTGFHSQGGFAEYCVADARFVFPLPVSYADEQMALLLCAGMIGYRALSLAGKAKKIGFYGFGVSAHILTQICVHYGIDVYAFTRPGDIKDQTFARSLGAVWAGSSEEMTPHLLDAAIIFASVGSLVPKALKDLKKGGVVVTAGIHMSPIPTFSYDLLWGERVLRSVANLTRKDGEELLALASKIPIRVASRVYPFEKANEAIKDFREGRLSGGAVLRISERDV